MPTETDISESGIPWYPKSTAGYHGFPYENEHFKLAATPFIKMNVGN